MRYNRLLIHVFAWVTFGATATMIGCGDGSDANYRDGIFVSGVELRPNTHVLPSDGSVVVTNLSDKGIQYRGARLDKAEQGDYVVSITPITAEARANINHIGGFVTLDKGLHIVPLEMMPERYHTNAALNHDHFLIHFGRVHENVIDTGSLAELGSVARSENRNISGVQTGSVGPIEEGIFGSVIHKVSHVAKSVTHGVTSEASKTTHAVTHAVTNASKVVTSSVSSVESEVSSAVSNIGAIGDAISTMKSVGVHFSEIVKSMDMDIDKLASAPLTIWHDAVQLAEFVLTGNITAGFDSEGQLAVDIDKLKVKLKKGEVSGTAIIDGSVHYKYEEEGKLTIKDYKPDSISASFKPEFDLSMTVEEITGSGSIELGKYNLTPVVIDAGIPVVVVREITVAADIEGSSNAAASLKASGSADIGMKVSTSSVDPHGSISVSGSGDATLSKESGSVKLQVTPKLKFYDVAGPSVTLSLIDLSAENKTGSSDVDLTLSSEAAIGLDMGGLGYGGWNTSKQIFSHTWKTLTRDLSDPLKLPATLAADPQPAPTQYNPLPLPIDPVQPPIISEPGGFYGGAPGQCMFDQCGFE